MQVKPIDEFHFNESRGYTIVQREKVVGLLARIQHKFGSVKKFSSITGYDEQKLKVFFKSTDKTFDARFYYLLEEALDENPQYEEILTKEHAIQVAEIKKRILLLWGTYKRFSVMTGMKYHQVIKALNSPSHIKGVSWWKCVVLILDRENTMLRNDPSVRIKKLNFNINFREDDYYFRNKQRMEKRLSFYKRKKPYEI